MDAPPSYEQVTGQSTGTSNRPASNTLHVPRNGIPPASRRSMEDEARALPPGWIRQYDHKEHHQFFVDTKGNPPRSIWHHPYDDDQYLKTLSSEERERLQETHHTPTTADLEAEITDDDEGHDHFAPNAGTLPPRPSATKRPSQSDSTTKSGFGRRMKDKITNSTHEEREEKRRLRAEQERKEYEAHMAFRKALSKAMETGQPQLLGKDKNGKDIYVEPPAGPGAGYGGYGGGGYGYNPYRQGPYSQPYSTGVYDQTPNARYIRPSYPYARPYGGGYGGGMGMPMMGGLMGGMMLGGLLF